jgi:protein-S-isoprenylcysteine O-methyltransferase Ste14
MNEPKSLRARAVQRLGVTLLVLGWLLFLPAGSLHFWQAWVFLALLAVFWIAFFVDLIRRDPRLMERRLQNRETEPQQKLFQKLFSLIVFAGFILPGLDFRFGWSREWLRPVPLALVIAAQVFVVAGYTLVFWVMRTNTFAASTIQVEAEHKVIATGPYAFVRHPMYTGMAMTMLGTPPALGSYIALPVFALIVPVLVYRLIHEERVLRRDLPGYAEYCQRIRFRLVPWLW